MPVRVLIHGSPASARTPSFLRLIRCFSSSSLVVIPFYTLSARDAPKRWILYTATSISEARNRAIVGPACELLLHGLRECRSLNVRVRRRLLSKFSVKVRSVKGIGLPCLDDVFKTNESKRKPTTLGLNVGSYLRCNNFLQSIALKNG